MRVGLQGRLDFNTEGLILFTNDGDLARQLEHPKNRVARRYVAEVKGKVPRMLDVMRCAGRHACAPAQRKVETRLRSCLVAGAGAVAVAALAGQGLNVWRHSLPTYRRSAAQDPRKSGVAGPCAARRYY